jgi:branched-chain amino acid transport system substrate-binding protein
MTLMKTFFPAFSLAAALSIATPVLADDAPGVTKNSVTIGAWVTLTGPVASYGVPYRAGAQAYFDAVNSKGGVNGRKITWIVDDNAYNPQQSVAVAKKLVARDNVLAVVLPHGTGQTAATFSFLIDQAKVPVLLPFGGAQDWYTPVKPGLFGLHVLYEEQGRALGQWAAKDGHKKVAVVHLTHASFQSAAEQVITGMTTVIPKEAAQVTLIAAQIGTTDFSPVLLEIARLKPDAVIAIQTAQDTSLLAKGLRQRGSKIPLYVYSSTGVQATIDLGGEFVEGMKALSLTLPPLADTPAVKEYREILAKYAPSEKPDFVSMWGFGAAKIFVAALGKAKEPLSRESLIEAFNSMGTYDSGIFPPVSFSKTKPLGGQLVQPMEVKQGRWVAVGDPIDTGKIR